MSKQKLALKTVRFIELTDAQWSIIEKKIDTGRKISKNLRTVVNCILKVCRTGCQWRNIDSCYGAWQSVYWNASPVLL
jgi:transposase